MIFRYEYIVVSCSVVQYFVVCCSMLQCAAVCCSVVCSGSSEVLPSIFRCAHVAVCCNVALYYNSSAVYNVAV